MKTTLYAFIGAFCGFIAAASLYDLLPAAIANRQSASAISALIGKFNGVTLEMRNVEQLIYVSGQFADDPETGKPLKMSIAEQTHFILKKIDNILYDAKSSLDEIVRVDVFLKNFNDWPAVEEEFKKHFVTDAPPARQVIEAPMGHDIEISCIAIFPLP